MIAAMALLGTAAVESRSQVVFGPRVKLGHASATMLGQGGVQIARAVNGISLAVWSDNSTGDHDVYGVLIDLTGGVIGSASGFKIAGTPGTNEGDPRVAACGTKFLVVWGNGSHDGNTTDVFATRVSTTGVVLDPTPIVISSLPAVQHNQRMPASDGVDTFLVAFRTTTDSIYGGINTMRVTASTGALLDPPGGVVLAMGSDAEGLKKNASVSFGAGEFFVTWDDERDRAHTPGEGIDIFGAFIDPASGVVIGAPFPTTRAFSCQEGSRSAYDGSYFLVAHQDERITNCVTADVYGERVTPAGVVLDRVDITGMIGGLEIASDPSGFPNTIQGGACVVASPCSRLVTYADSATASQQVALRMKRLTTDGLLEGNTTASQPGTLIAIGAAGVGVTSRAEAIELSPGTYLLAYALNTEPTLRWAKYALPPTLVIANPTAMLPLGLAVDNAGKIFAMDYNSNLVQVFDRTGKFAFSFGGAGSTNGKFNRPHGVALDSSGNVYVPDTGNSRVQVFSSSGSFLFKFGALGSGNGQFNLPHGIAIGPNGDIYIADLGNNRVQVFDKAGMFKFKFGSTGIAPGQFRGVRAIGIEPGTNRIVVADRDNNRVQIFSPSGVFVSILNYSFLTPNGVAFDHVGRLYIADSSHDQVAMFKPSGQTFQLLQTIGARGTGAGQFYFPVAVAIDNLDRLHVAEFYNKRIQVFGCMP